MARLEKQKAALAMKLRLEKDVENKKQFWQDENASFLEPQDDSQMTDISQGSFPGVCNGDR